MLGNWERYQFDGGGFTDNLDDVRAHAAPGGLANEITEWFPWPAGSPVAERPAEPAYDEPRTMTGQDYILADLNLDGVVDQTDLNLFSNYSGATGGWGVLTSSTARCASSRLNSPRNAASMRPRSSRLIDASVPMPKSRANPAPAMCYWAPARVASRHSAEELRPFLQSLSQSP